MSKTNEQLKDLFNLVAGCVDDKLSFNTFIECYFKNDGETILKGILSEAKDPEVMLATLRQMNYAAQSDIKINQFGDLQSALTEQLINENNKMFVDTNLVNDAREIGEENTPNITAAKEQVNKLNQPVEVLEYSKAA